METQQITSEREPADRKLRLAIFYGVAVGAAMWAAVLALLEWWG